MNSGSPVPGAMRHPQRAGKAVFRSCHLAVSMLVSVVVTEVASAAPQPDPDQIANTAVLDLNALPDLERIVPLLADKRVVFVGEQHDRYEHHLTQLEIIRRLHALHPKMAIGMEAFQQPFQHNLDDYVSGRIDETELLKGTEYYARWQFDFRLYAPILAYAREKRLPVIALNLPQELTRKVGRGGHEALTDTEKAQLPAHIDRSDDEYARRLREIYDLHPQSGGQSFENFMEVQLLWDEGMADRAAAFLTAHPDHHMVILAGGGHLAYGSGIPRRLTRRLPVSTAIVLNGWQGTPEPTLADFLLLPEERSLPAAGRLGALLSSDENRVTIDSCEQDSACEEAGIKRGDQLVAIDNAPIAGMEDVRLALWDKKPGDEVSVDILRRRWLAKPKKISYPLKLRASQ
jgi:uncharacterized iron-regulated protein